MLRAFSKRLVVGLMLSVLSSGCSDPSVEERPGADAGGSEGGDAGSSVDAPCVCSNGTYGLDAEGLACFCSQKSCSPTYETAALQAQSLCQTGTNVVVAISSHPVGCTMKLQLLASASSGDDTSLFFDPSTHELVGGLWETDTPVCGATGVSGGDTLDAWGNCGFCVLCGDPVGLPNVPKCSEIADASADGA